LDELKRYLWDSAVLLRNHIDAGSYKQYIFPLLFFKRLCDVYDQERRGVIETYGEDDADFAEYHRFSVPSGAHWADVRNASEDVGQAIRNAFLAIERANNEKLDGVFGDGAWTNKSRLPDRLLKNLIEHFSKLTLSLDNCPEDELGQGYEYLVGQFAEDSGHTAQEFYTNRTVVHLMTELLKPRSGESIYDPTCGSAGMLISAVAHLKSRGLEWRNLRLFGQEINALTSTIARMNLFLHGIEDFQIVNDDTLLKPAFINGGRLDTFDVVVANPPYSIKEWNRQAFMMDKYGRNFLGTPPQGRADYAFFQHILKSMDPKTGRSAVLFPHGVLFRVEESALRKNLVKLDLIECVIGIGPNLFFNSTMEACIVVASTVKPPERRNRILFVNAVNEVTRRNSQSYLEDVHIAKIAKAFEEFADVEGFAKIATAAEVSGNAYSLSIPLYVSEAGIGEEVPNRTIEEHANEWKSSSIQMWNEFETLVEMIKNNAE
jgi:type I restriction enzyme M protein